MYEDIFEVDEAGMHRKGNWLWWWWIFYYRQPKETPKQLMILWSTKNEKHINCNGLDVRLRNEFIKRDDNSLNIDGVVAAWYYDGKQMHENYLLDQTSVIVNSQSVKTGKPDSSFEVNSEGFEVKLRDLEFDVFNIQKNGFYAPQYRESKFPGTRYSYDIHKITRADFKASNGSGTAYFQRVRVNAPAPPWYWGVHHFDNGEALHYYEPHFSSTLITDKAKPSWALPIKQEFEFYDGKRVHRNKSVRVKREGSKEKPHFIVESSGPAGKARVVIKAYAAAAWRFNKSSFNRFTYNEYPSLVEEFRFKNASGEWTIDDLGTGYGNSEHSTGLLW